MGLGKLFANASILRTGLADHMPSETSTTALKDWFDPALYRRLAKATGAIDPKFDQARFLKLVLDGLDQRELMARLQQTAIAMGLALPGSYRQQVAVLRELAPAVGHEFVSIFLCDFVSRHGLEDFDFSMEALRYFTCFGSAEFAVRPFIDADQARSLRTMMEWTSDADEKVRRLASEGCRPMLPWGQRLGRLVRDPTPLVPILEALKDDSSLFVRRSVANNLNDISKHHPGWLLKVLGRWDLNQDHLRWIAKHACRTLIKKGDPGALALFGFGKKPQVNAELKVSPSTISLGDRLEISLQLASGAASTQALAVDYIVHYVKASGGRSPKVFKWTELDLPAKGQIALRKTQLIKDFSTRKHHAGEHLVEIQINGQKLAQATFLLR